MRAHNYVHTAVPSSMGHSQPPRLRGEKTVTKKHNKLINSLFPCNLTSLLFSPTLPTLSLFLYLVSSLPLCPTLPDLTSSSYTYILCSCSVLDNVASAPSPSITVPRHHKVWNSPNQIQGVKDNMRENAVIIVSRCYHSMLVACITHTHRHKRARAIIIGRGYKIV